MRIRPRAKPAEIASVNRSISASRYVFAISVARKAARAHIASAGRNGVVDLRFKQGCGLGLGFFRIFRWIHCLDSPYAHIRTK